MKNIMVRSGRIHAIGAANYCWAWSTDEAPRPSVMAPKEAPAPTRSPKQTALFCAIVLLSNVGVFIIYENMSLTFHVNNEYDLPEMNENPPAAVDIARVMRNILADSPRVTRWSDINWDLDAAPMQPMDQPGAMHADPSMGGAPMDTQTSAMMGGEQVMAA